MLILVGTVPTAYALNHAVDASQVQTFVAVSGAAHQALDHYNTSSATSSDHKADRETFLSSKKMQPSTLPALIDMVDQIKQEVGH